MYPHVLTPLSRDPKVTKVNYQSTVLVSYFTWARIGDIREIRDMIWYTGMYIDQIARRKAVR